MASTFFVGIAGAWDWCRIFWHDQYGILADHRAGRSLLMVTVQYTERKMRSFYSTDIIILLLPNMTVVDSIIYIFTPQNRTLKILLSLDVEGSWVQAVFNLSLCFGCTSSPIWSNHCVESVFFFIVAGWLQICVCLFLLFIGLFLFRKRLEYTLVLCKNCFVRTSLSPFPLCFESHEGEFKKIRLI